MSEPKSTRPAYQLSRVRVLAGRLAFFEEHEGGGHVQVVLLEQAHVAALAIEASIGEDREHLFELGVSNGGGSSGSGGGRHLRPHQTTSSQCVRNRTREAR